jgi:hypothetical protein
MHDTGFADSYVQHLASPDSMVVGIKYPGRRQPGEMRPSMASRRG